MKNCVLPILVILQHDSTYSVFFLNVKENCKTYFK